MNDSQRKTYENIELEKCEMKRLLKTRYRNIYPSRNVLSYTVNWNQSKSSSSNLINKNGERKNSFTVTIQASLYFIYISIYTRFPLHESLRQTNHAQMSALAALSPRVSPSCFSPSVQIWWWPLCVLCPPDWHQIQLVLAEDHSPEWK